MTCLNIQSCQSYNLMRKVCIALFLPFWVLLQIKLLQKHSLITFVFHLKWPANALLNVQTYILWIHLSPCMPNNRSFFYSFMHIGENVKTGAWLKVYLSSVFSASVFTFNSLSNIQWCQSTCWEKFALHF